jgi:hypothetical protein
MASKLAKMRHLERVRVYSRVYNKKYYQSKKESLQLKYKIWYESNKDTVLATNAKRRAYKLNAIPKWLSLEHNNQMNQIYKNRPKGFHVDHIIPLKGKDVSGLHVPWNLQYLTAYENLSKKNRVL